MTNILKDAKQILKTRNLSLTARQISAILTMMALLLPIAAPIPVWAQNMNLPRFADSGLRLTADGPTLAESSVDLVGELFKGFASFVYAGKVEEKKREKPFSREELEKRVKGIETQISEEQEIKAGQLLALTGIPVDMDQNPVNGLAVEWKSSDEQILKITNNEMAVAVEEGKATLTASSGKTNREIVVNVSAGSKASNLDDLPLEPTISEEQAANMVSPENNLGNPPGQTELTGRSRAAAARTRERHGSSNYSFGLPVASLPGRGIDASVGIAYNSRVWNKSTIFGETSFEFNTNKNWLAPGFEVGYGYIEGYFAGFSYGYLLTAPDGTRSQLIQKQSSGNCTTYESADGTFVQTTVCGSYGQATAIVVRYADGSQVTYGPHTQTGKRYPTGIQDRNGNYITIAYIQNDMQGKIAYIKDTLNRYITFNYDTTPEKKLVAVTVPGFDDSPTPRQTIRFYYEDMALQTAGRFDDQTYVNAPATINVLRHVYFPGTQTGFRYDYSPYFGMIYKISQRRGMQVTTTSLTDTGTVVNEGTEASWTHYNYAATPGELGGIPLTDVPKYSWRKDDWQGRTTTVPQTNFFTDEAVTPTNCEISAGTCTGTRTTTITAPDGTRSVSVSNIRPTADWENGLLSETRISTIESSAERVWSKTRLYWEQGDNQPTGRDNPRLSKIEVTNDAGQTRATNFAYDGYNNPSVVSEHDFAAEGVLGAELRRTETTYETGAGWIANRMIRLPKEIKTVVGSTTVSKVQYEYDNYSGGNGLVNAPGVMQHSQKFNPFNPGTHVCNCRWECDLSLAGGETDGADPSQAQSCPGPYPPVRVCYQCPNIPDSYRGNVTKMTAFSDATLAIDTNASVTTVKYDITGNAVETGVSCCRLKTYEYDLANGYA